MSAHPTDEGRVSVPLEHLHEDCASRSKGARRERYRGIGQFERPRDVDRSVPAEPRGQVADDHVDRLSKELEEPRLDWTFHEIATNRLNAFDRGDRNLVDDDVSRTKQTVPLVDLGELDCRTTPVSLFLRGAVETVVLPRLDPRFPHFEVTMPGKEHNALQHPMGESGGPSLAPLK